MSEGNRNIDWSVTTWEGSRRAQLRHALTLSLRERLEAVEGLGEVAGRFEQMHRERAFHALSSQSSHGTHELTGESPETYQTVPVPNDLQLPGCTPEPLMAYLKALGILRLVSEQKDPNARGWWKHDVFWLRAPDLFKGADTEEAKREKIAQFFLEEYRPTPIVAPWAGGSGFFRKDNKKAVEQLRESKSVRVQSYAKVIRIIQQILIEESVGDKPKEEEKTRLINRYRREMPDEVVAWMDASMILQKEGQDFSPLLGTGGNDGRLDFTQNFMQRIVTLGLHNNGKPSEPSRAWLAQALFLSPAQLIAASVGQFAPGRMGGPNATQGMEGQSIDNPWEFLLTMEGVFMLAGAAVRRFGANSKSRATFPFTVRPIAAGFNSSSPKDEAESRGELWLPLWIHPTTTHELCRLFGEGRAELSGRIARDGTDFARAVAELGVDRGIGAFSRVGFLKRSGKAFLASPLGRFEVIERSDVDLLRQSDPWVNAFRRAATGKNVPPRFASTLRGIDSAIFAFCKYGGPRLFQDIIMALGRIERELSIAERFRNEKKLKPLAGLSKGWIKAADDHSSEFAIALVLASLNDPETKIGPLRANLEAVDWKKHCRIWAEKDRTVVWNAGNLVTNLTNVLRRRMMDGQRAGCHRLPLASRSPVSLDTVSHFLNQELDDQRIEDLLWGLILIDQREMQHSREDESSDHPMPRTYALLKLLFLPRPVVAERAGGNFRWRLARKDEEGILIRPEPRILPLLQAGRVGEACRIGAQRLRISGLSLLPGPLPDGKTRDSTWAEFVSDPCRAQRLAASLLIPIDSASVNRIVHLICRDELAHTAT